MAGTPDKTTQALPDFFISRAGADALFAEAIGHIIERAGHRVVLQQWDFTNRNFMERMHAAILSGARVIALLSNEYLASKHCEAEWLNAIATDPLNTNERLVVLRVNECTPRGLLTALAYWDLVPIRDQIDLVRDVVLTAIKLGRHKGEGTASAQYWRAARTVLHSEIKPMVSFTGRASELIEIDKALRSDDTTAVTQPAVVYGLGGIGKSTLARAYAYQVQSSYAGVWWLSAARSPDSNLWEEVENGLVALGNIFIPGLDQVQDRAKAARQTLELIANGGFAKPWLFVYDSVDDVAVLHQWAPVGNARVLVTSRLGAWRTGVAKIEVKEWTMPEATSYLLKESGRSNITAANAEVIAAALGRLPLALSHAAAYLRENENATAESYLAAIAQHMREVPESAEHNRAVFATFQEQAAQVELRVLGARAILSLAAFYAPDNIPEELFSQTAEHYPAAFAPVAANPVKLEQAIGALNRFSLVDFVADTRAFSVHRLVQAATRDALAIEASQWVESALHVAYAVFPEPNFRTWPVCERLIPHIRAVASQVTADSGELAWLLVRAGIYLRERAALSEVLPLYERALAIFDRLAKANPGNADCQRGLAASHEHIGSVLVDQGNLPAALDHYEAMHAVLDRLATADPGNANCWRNLSLSDDWIGSVLVAQGNLPAALDHYETAYALRERLATIDPGDTDCQRDLSLSHDRIGHVLQAQGNLPAALDHYDASLALRDRLAKADPGNAECERDVAVSHDKIGSVLVEQGNLPAALDHYEASLAIFDRLAKANPGNTYWQREPFVSHSNIGRVLKAQGNLPAALDRYEAALAIVDRLSKADPGNAGWQDDLADSRQSIGDILRAGRLLAALDHYEASHAIFGRLAKADPGNAEWQRGLAVSHNNIGDVLRAQGNLPAALDHYEASLAIVDRLSKADPGNVLWQRDPAVAHNNIGDVLRAQGNLPAALDHYETSLAIVDRLSKADPGNVRWQRNSISLHNEIGSVLVDQGNLPAALDRYEASLAVADRLAKADPGNTRWQRDPAVLHNKIGDILRAQGNLPAALDRYEASHAIFDRLAKADPGNADWQHNVAVSHGKIGVLRAQGSLKMFGDSATSR